MDGKEAKAKKQVPLRLSPALYIDLAAWAVDDFRSVNGQIEYLLTECVKWRRRGGRAGMSAWRSSMTSAWSASTQVLQPLLSH